MPPEDAITYNKVDVVSNKPIWILWGVPVDILSIFENETRNKSRDEGILRATWICS
jgi:hypothetical protein